MRERQKQIKLADLRGEKHFSAEAYEAGKIRKAKQKHHAREKSLQK